MIMFGHDLYGVASLLFASRLFATDTLGHATLSWMQQLYHAAGSSTGLLWLALQLQHMPQLMCDCVVPALALFHALDCFQDAS
jgi:hypothetical protein